MSKKIILAVVLCAAVGGYFAAASMAEKNLRSALRESGITVQRVSVRPALASFLRGRPALDLELTAPELSLQWRKEGLSGFSPGPLRASLGRRLPVVLLRAREGRAVLLDRTVSPETAWDLRGIELTARVDWQSRQCSFEGMGSLADSGGRESGGLKVQGSALLSRGPVDAAVFLRHDRVGDLAPYLRQVLGTAPDRGTVDLSSKVTLHGGVLMSRNEVTASGILFPTEDPTALGPDGNRLIQLIEDPDGKAHLSFVVTGEAGKGLDWSDLGAAAMRESVKQAMARGIQRLLSGADRTPVEKAVREGLDSLGR